MTGLMVNWPVTLLAIALFAVAGVIAAWRFCFLIRPFGHKLSLFDSVQLTFVGQFFNTCLPGSVGGDAARLYYIARDSSRARTELATLVMMDRLCGMFALFLWPVLAIPFFSDLIASSPMLRNLIATAGLASVAILTGMLLVMTERFRYNRLLARLLGRSSLGNILERSLGTLHNYRRHGGVLAGAVAVSLVIHTILISLTLLVALAIDGVHSSWKIALVAPLGLLANVLPVTPGGLGVGEAAFASLFKLAGLAGGPMVMLGWRVVTFCGSLAGLVFYLRWKKSWGTHLSRVEPGSGPAPAPESDTNGLGVYAAPARIPKRG